MSSSEKCFGLYALEANAARVPVHMEHIDIQSKVVGLSREDHVRQIYTNKSNKVVECHYAFPITDNAAICQFKATINDEEITGVVKEKEEARREYETAKANGQAVALGEQYEKNEFHIKIGNLLPNSRCVIDFTYIATLDSELKQYRFVIPQAIMMKYTPNKQITDNIMKRDSEFSLINALCDKLGVDLNLNDNNNNRDIDAKIQYQPLPPELVNISVDIVMPSRITNLVSTSHASRIRVDRPNPNSTTATVCYSDQRSTANPEARAALDADFVLLIQEEQYDVPRLIKEVDPATNSTALQLVFTPPAASIESTVELPCEMIFILDRSGSMGGSRMNSLRDTMQIILRALPPNCKFNLIGFGDNSMPLFETSEVYSDATLKTASSYTTTMQADMGGTEILKPLSYALQKLPSDPHFPRQVFLLTDGDVSNTDEVVSLVAQHTGTTRVFTFGIGESCSRDLIKRIAEVGNGFYEFVSTTQHATNNITDKTVAQLTRALQPCVSNVNINWLCDTKNVTSSSTSIVQYPEKILPIYNSCRSIVYGINIDNSMDVIKQINVTGITNDCTANQRQITLPFVLDTYPNQVRSHVGTVVHKLAVKARIMELETAYAVTGYGFTRDSMHAVKAKRKIIKDEIIKLSLANNLVSRFTSFIAVSSNKKVTEIPAQFQSFDSTVAASNGYHSTCSQPQALSNTNTHHFALFGPSAISLTSAAPQTFPTHHYYENLSFGGSIIPQGPQGPQGINNNGGPVPQGPQGINNNGGPGPQGPRCGGNCGVKGPQGVQDLYGLQGPAGECGATGPGPQGLQGLQGPRGGRGVLGPSYKKRKSLRAEIQDEEVFEMENESKLTFIELMQLQQFDKQWHATPTIIQQLSTLTTNKDIDQIIKTLKQQYSELDANIFITMIVLAILESVFTNEKSKWMLGATQSRSVLKTIVKRDLSDVQATIVSLLA